MRVLFVSCDPVSGAVTRYRCTNLASALISRGHMAEVATIYDPVIRLSHDIVVLHRICANREGMALARAVRKSGAALIYGADDLVFEDGLHREMLLEADAALVSTNSLATMALEAGAKQAFVVRNFIADTKSDLVERTIKPETEEIVLCYPSGTPTHDADLATIGEALAEVLQKYPNVRLRLIGPVTLPKELESKRGQIERLPFLSRTELNRVLASADINLAPLAPTRFNQGKSELKWLEAGALHVPTVASDWGGFSEAIKNGVSGLLAGGSALWIAHLSQLIESRAERVRLSAAAIRHLSCDIGRQTTAIDDFANQIGDRASEIRNIAHVNTLGCLKGYAKRAVHYSRKVVR